ncbi:stage III sporulation protein AH [Jeotgalibacillus sp. ET6]|uniref:stage III sporulation protein AH n=1 Tax=Jeotgalibacillus sp. ET6 TaxID=3037260 RepID=UPI00241857A0|nr:stage III sporulation protein AH [Jeotgalibacillus sp. ET6]MDG5471327.1 stage III sporulation protein AH [Jeotgalibacillus sp. ET6]
MLMINKDVKGKRYKHLIDLLSRNCNRFAFVENRQLMEIEEERLAYVDDIISDIRWHLIERRIQKEWETTKLLEDTAYVFYFQLNNDTTQFLKERSNSLFDWMGNLPEDLQFYHDEKCILAVCCHEKFFLVEETFWDRFLLN